MTDMIYAFLEMKYRSPKHAQQRALKFKNCPQVIFWGLKSETAYIILSVPIEKRFWVDYIKDNPEKSFGGTEVSLHYLDHSYSPMSVSTRPSSKNDRSPCDSFCPECPYYSKACNGCPATKYHTVKQS